MVRKQCVKCGKLFDTYYGKFCSRSCSVSFTNVGTVRHGRKRKEGKCQNCHMTVYGSKKFCSNKCSGNHKFNEVVSKWISGSNGNVKGNILSTSIRHFLITLSNESCTKCGWNAKNPKTGKPPLHIDHIDGDHRNSYVSNLCVLCPNCHSLTETFGALNKGRGRKLRR